MKIEKSQHVLITGGAGFIGSYLSVELLRKGYQLTILDSFSEQIHGGVSQSDSIFFQKVLPYVHLIRDSVTNKQALVSALEKANFIIHFAAETGTGQSMYEIEKYSNVNIQGTALLLDILRNTHHQVKKVIVASSRAIYGEGKYFCSDQGTVFPEGRSVKDMEEGRYEVTHTGCKDLTLTATDENSKIHPSSLYGITKQVQEQMIMSLCPTMGINPVALRYQNVYGPGQSLSNPYTGILSIFSSLLLRNEAVNIFEDGLESRDFVYIADVVDATILALEKEEANDEIFNVGTGIPVTVLKVAETLKNLYASASPINISGQFRIGDIRHNYADISKISKKLGFSSKYSFESGIKVFSEWVKTQTLPKSDFENSLKEMSSKGLLK